MGSGDPGVGGEFRLEGVACCLGWSMDEQGEYEVAEAFEEGRGVEICGVFQVKIEVTEEDVVG